MYGLGGAYCREVAVALVCKHQAAGIEAVGGSGESRGAAVGGLYPVDVDIIVCKDGTTDGCDAYGAVGHTHFFENLGDEFVHYAVRTSGAIVCVYVAEQVGAAIHFILGADNFFLCHGALEF